MSISAAELVGTEMGMVHGRFQPFHSGHLEYATAASARCTHLIVGITNPDPTHVRAEVLNPGRSASDANPFPFHLRYRMVCAALLEAGLNPRRLSVVPFPIHEPELWSSYVPSNTVHFLRVFSPWEAAKVERLRERGFVVQILDEGSAKRVSGTDVRRLLREGGQWEKLVPAAVARLIEESLARGEVA